jgi:hypothetical protein|tara:strand:+ start:37 stop:492 length:456 start_codon:yes stop_codon:yes gene_type:complete
MSYASGKRSLAISDRSGQAFPYREMVKEWTGALVHISEFEPKHPQIDPPYHKADAVALQNPRTMKFQQPTDISTINPQAPNDDTIADSGGIFVGVANLTLPGDFAFRTQDFQVTSNGITTTIHSMIPEDPSLQNRRRELISSLGSVEVSIT